MKALFFGSNSWGDSYMMDLLIGGLKWQSERVEIQLYDGDHEGAANRARISGESSGTLLVSLDGTPNMVFVLHDGLPQDVECLARLRGWEREGVPIYHIRHMDRATIGRLWEAARRRKVELPQRKSRVRGGKNANA